LDCAEFVLEKWQTKVLYPALRNLLGKNMITDPVTDMLNRIKNGLSSQKEMVEVPYSNFKYEIAKILEQENFIGKAEKKGRKSKKILEITLKYEDKAPAILGVKRVSRPGQRIYAPSQNIKKVRGGYGISIVSTSKGLMTGKEARKQKVGGEILCEIW
jgi:small subunit ribosomal protein S8